MLSIAIWIGIAAAIVLAGAWAAALAWLAWISQGDYCADVERDSRES